MPREAEPSLNEREFVIKALQEGQRLDGRAFDQFRKLDLQFGDQYGVADVTLGKTRVLANVSAEVTAPYADRPFDGIFTIATELSPMASPAFEVNRPTETEVLLSRLIEKTVRRSNALDLESLCLIAAHKCWSIRVDLHVLSTDGNLIDTSCLAVVAALRHFKKPDTSMEGDIVTIYTPAEREPVPLSWLHSPFCVTFSFYGENGEIMLADASLLEEQLRVSSCTISMNKHGEICQVAKLGGTAVEAISLIQCASAAVTKVKEFSTLVDLKLADDLKRRDRGGLLAELSAENER
ncbi:ribosomal protein S5 domain 2-type protein [Xylaria palmicola]|nr:ribosomal protein S5 domain 2-type protein [Xylaria palmicola]